MTPNTSFEGTYSNQSISVFVTGMALIASTTVYPSMELARAIESVPLPVESRRFEHVDTSPNSGVNLAQATGAPSFENLAAELIKKQKTMPDDMARYVALNYRKLYK